MFTFDLQLFAKVDNPYNIKSTDLDYKNPNYTSYMENPLYPEGSLRTNSTGMKTFNKDGSLAYWFKNNIPDINSISSIYDSISSNKNYFDEKIVVTDNIDNLFSDINFTNMDEINKILSKIFLGNKGVYLNTVQMDHIYDGINMFKTTDNKYKTTYPNNFELKPKLLNGFVSQYLFKTRDSYSLFGGAFVKTLNISEFNLLPKSDGNNQYYDKNPGNDIYGMFKDCIAQTIVGLDKFPFKKFKNCGDYMFAGAFNLDKYIDKIEDPDTKKKLKKAYYNTIEAITLAEYTYDNTKEIDLDKVLFEYWVKPLKLKKDSFGIGYKIYSGGGRGNSITGTFKEAYINCVDLSDIDLTNYSYMINMFKDASINNIVFDTIGSKVPQSQFIPNYSNLFNVSKNGPFKLRNITGTIIFPDEKYMKISFSEPDPPESGYKKCNRLKNMLPSKEALAPGVTRLNLKFKNYNKEALLKFVQENGGPEITTEDQLFELFGLPKSYIQFEDEVTEKPADFDTNPYSDKAIAYMKYNGIHMEEPDDLETNVYGDASVAFRKLYNLPLPKPADYDTNPYSNEANIWAKFYNISRPSPPLMST